MTWPGTWCRKLTAPILCLPCSVYGCPLAKKRKSLDIEPLETSPKRSTLLDDMDNSTMEECYDTDGTEEMDDREEEEEEGAMEGGGEVVEEEEDVGGYMDYNVEQMEHENEEGEERGEEEDIEEEDVEVEQEEEEDSDEVRVEEAEEEEEEAIEEVDYEDDEEEEEEEQNMGQGESMTWAGCVVNGSGGEGESKTFKGTDMVVSSSSVTN